MVLQITNEQLRQLEKVCLENFFKRLMTYLSDFDSEGFGALEEDVRRERIGHIHSGAKGFSAETEREVILFGELCCLLGTETIDEVKHPWYYQQLVEPDEDRTRTLEYLRDVARDKQASTGETYA